MNRTLAIHFETDYLIAAIKPFDGKFEQITKRGTSRFPFYFFIDNINNKIDYSFEYQKHYENQKSNYVGDFIASVADPGITYQWYGYDSELINLFAEILDDLKKGYYHILTTNGATKDELKNKAIPLTISFSDNITTESIRVVKSYLVKNGFSISQNERCFPELIASQFVELKSINVSDLKIAVIEAIGNNLNMSLVRIYNDYDKERSFFKSFRDYGTDPRLSVLAKKIVDDINKHEGILGNSDDLKKEYKRHIPLARKYLEQIENSKRPFLSIDTSFRNDRSRKFSTTIMVDEIEQLTAVHIRQLSRFFSDQFLAENNMKAEETDHIILIGNMLNNDFIKEEFSRFDTSKIMFYTDNDIKLALMALLQNRKTKPENKLLTITENSPKEIPFVALDTLKVGQTIILQNNNTDKTKGSLGKSIQTITYLGNNKFKIISSTRSLQKGDIATALTPNWVPSIQIDFSIEREGKVLGRFRTRMIEKIEIIESKIM